MKISHRPYPLIFAGVYKNDGPYDLFVDINKVRELHQISKDTPLIVGGGVNLTDLQGILSSIGSTNPDYWYGSTLADHVGKIGSVPLRNVCQV